MRACGCACACVRARTCAHARTGIVRALLEAGANVDCTTNGLNMHSALYITCFNGHLSVARTLLHAQASVRIADRDGHTPIHTAAESGHAAVVSALIEAGAAADVVNSAGHSPVFLASEKGLLAVVAVLIEARAALNGQTKDSNPL